MLRDKFPNTLEECQEWAGDIEENMLASKVETCSAPCAKAETNPKDINNVYPTEDYVVALGQKFDQVTTKILQTQAILLNKITILEKVPSPCNSLAVVCFYFLSNFI